MSNVIRKVRCSIYAAMAFELTIGITGCASLFSSDKEAIVLVDSITAPASIAQDERLTARFWGMVGPDGCWRLSDVERQATLDSLVIRFHAKYKDGPCTQMPVQLDYGDEVLPPLHDPFTIIARQPSGPSLRKTVRVGAQ